VLSACRASAGELCAIVESKDPELFRIFFEQNSRHLGDNCRKGLDITDTLIESMVNR
jgi:prephenate dehydrogenase